MAPKTLRQLGILAVLLLVFVAILVYNRDPLAGGAGQSRTAALPPAQSPVVGSREVGAVQLPALTMARPEPEIGARNPFRFRPAAPPPPPPGPERPGGLAGSAGPAMPVGPPPPPPITLKFIGVVEQSSRLKLAVLSDGRNVFYGKEGDAIEGRYRILRIGAESIDMAYLDGRGRQTLRLSGS